MDAAIPAGCPTRSGFSTASTAFGISGTIASSGSCTSVVPPASWIAASLAEPSFCRPKE
jgi:hypothetical protein